jgi:hypothetical protein
MMGPGSKEGEIMEIWESTTEAHEWLKQAESDEGASREATQEKLLFSIAASLLEITEELKSLRPKS